MVITEMGLCLTPANFCIQPWWTKHYPPRVSQISYFPRGVNGEKIHKNNPNYSYTRTPTHPQQRMPPTPHHNMPPHLYPSITPHQVCLCPYCNSTPKYAPYVVPNYPHIPTIGYLHTYSIRLPPSVSPPHPPPPTKYEWGIHTNNVRTAPFRETRGRLPLLLPM